MKYLLKTKGTVKIPDYLQIRDENFELIAHCTVKNSKRIIEKNNIKLKSGDINKLIKEMPFGKLTKIIEQ